MKLPDKANLTIAKVRCGLIGQRTQPEFGAVYVTFGRPFKRSKKVQKRTFARTRLADNPQHLSLRHLEGQVLKEHQV
jgi:hypothetical protein